MGKWIWRREELRERLGGGEMGNFGQNVIYERIIIINNLRRKDAENSLRTDICCSQSFTSPTLSAFLL